MVSEFAPDRGPGHNWAAFHLLAGGVHFRAHAVSRPRSALSGLFGHDDDSSPCDDYPDFCDDELVEASRYALVADTARAHQRLGYVFIPAILPDSAIRA